MDSKIILPLDVPTKEEAVTLARDFYNDVGLFKIGLEQQHATGGPQIVRAIASRIGADRIFYDCKLHDIPATVAGAARAITRMGVWGFNVHTTGGLKMMQAAREAVDSEIEEISTEMQEGNDGTGSRETVAPTPPFILGVTLLTSLDQEAMNTEIGIPGDVADEVARLAELAQEAGLDGIIASPQEIEIIRRVCGPDFLIVTPGVRPAGSSKDDQKRVMTPGEAISLGADYLVIGRPITKADDPSAAAKAINDEVSIALTSRTG